MSRAWQSMWENHQGSSLRAPPRASPNRSGAGPAVGGRRLCRRPAPPLRWTHERHREQQPPHTPDLPPDRRDRRVRDAQGRCQGQGPQGRGPPGDRLRRRRARLPDPRLRRRGGRRRLPRPEEPPLHPRRRPARAQAGDRGQDAARQRLRRVAGPDRGHQRRQAGHLRGLRHHARPGRRGDRAGAVLDDVPRGDPARRRRRRPRARRRDPGLQGHRRPARGRPHRAHQGAALRLAVQPDRRGLHRRRDPGDRSLGRGPRAVGAHRRDLRAPRLRRRRDRLAAGALPRAGRQLRRRQRRGQDLRDDRLAGGLADRAHRPRRRRRQPAVPRDLQRLQRLPASGARRGHR